VSCDDQHEIPDQVEASRRLAPGARTNAHETACDEAAERRPGHAEREPSTATVNPSSDAPKVDL